MRIEDELRRRLSAATEDATATEELRSRIEQAVPRRRRRRQAAARIATAALALALFATVLTWAGLSLTRRQHPATTPNTVIKVSGVGVVGGGDPSEIGKVYGTIRNVDNSPHDALVLCVVRDALGRPVAQGRFGPLYLPARGAYRDSTFFGFRPARPAASATCRATVLPPTPPSPNPPVRATFVPDQIAFWDAEHGVALGAMNPCVDQRSECQAIASTDDGGLTWVKRLDLRPQESASTVAIAGVSSAWISSVDAICRFECPRIYRSTDSGHTWTRVGSAPVWGLSFVDSSVGFALEGLNHQHDFIGETTDGGATWKESSRSPCDTDTYTRESDAVSFVSATRGWILCTGGAGGGSVAKAIFATNDAGKSWTRLLEVGLGPGAPRGPVEALGTPEGMVFLPSGRGWLVQGVGRSYQTADGGQTWTPIVITRPEEVWAFSISFVSDHEGFMMLSSDPSKPNQGKRLLHTRDGGRTWQLVRTWPIGT